MIDDGDVEENVQTEKHYKQNNENMEGGRTEIKNKTNEIKQEWGCFR